MLWGQNYFRGPNKKLGIDNFWNKLLGIKIGRSIFLGGAEGSYVILKMGELPIYGGCAQILPF